VTLLRPSSDQERWRVLAARLGGKRDAPLFAAKIGDWRTVTLRIRCAFFALGAIAAAMTLLIIELLHVPHSLFVSGIVLIAAGLYQWTPIKDVCLRQCQAPWLFIQNHGGFRADAVGSLAIGARHGAYCVGCCWVVMALLFVGGVMNVLWIALIASFVLAEKIIPAGRILSRIAGVVFVLAGLWVVANS